MFWFPSIGIFKSPGGGIGSITMKIDFNLLVMIGLAAIIIISIIDIIYNSIRNTNNKDLSSAKQSPQTLQPPAMAGIPPEANIPRPQQVVNTPQGSEDILTGLHPIHSGPPKYPTRPGTSQERMAVRLFASIIGLFSIFLAWYEATVNVSMLGYGASQTASATLTDIISHSGNNSISLGGGIFIIGCLIGFVSAYAVVFQILGMILVVPNLSAYTAGVDTYAFGYSMNMSIGIGVVVAVVSVLIMAFIAAFDYLDHNDI
jgi:hypothetical protein